MLVKIWNVRAVAAVHQWRGAQATRRKLDRDALADAVIHAAFAVEKIALRVCATSNPSHEQQASNVTTPTQPLSSDAPPLRRPLSS